MNRLRDRRVRMMLEDNVAAAIPWYLSGGVALANVLRVYEAANVASKAVALQNVISPGTLDLVENGTVTWDAVKGFSGFGNTNFFNGGNLSTNYSIVIRFAGATNSSDYPRLLYAGGSESILLTPYAVDGNGYTQTNNLLWTYARVASGVLIVTPTKAFLNGTDLGAPGTGAGTYTGSDWALGRAKSTSDPYPATGSVSYMAVYDVDIASQAVAISTALSALP